MWHTLISLTDLVISLLFFLGQCKQCYSGIHPSKCTFTSQVIDISKVSVGYVSRSGVAILLALFHNTYFYIYPIAWLANCLIWKKAYIIEFWQKNTLVITNPIFQQYKRRLYIWTSPDGWHWNRLIIFFVSKDEEAVYSQQKQDWELTMAWIMISLLPNSDWNLRKWRKPLDHSGMT